MLSLPYSRYALAFLLWLGPAEALAQDNPWRVPGYGESWQNRGSAPQGNSGGWQPAQGYSGGYAGNGYTGNSYAGNGYAGGQGHAYGTPEASLQQHQQQARGYNQPANSTADSWRQNRFYGGPSSDYPGNYANPGYNVPSTMPPSYLYGRQYGEFPPLEGEERKPSAESLPPPAPPPAPPRQQSYGYGQGY
jgi:hypothetical protein